MSLILRGFTTGTIITRGFGTVVRVTFTFLVEMVRSLFNQVEVNKIKNFTGTVEIVRNVFIVSMDPTYVSFQVDLTRNVSYTVEREN